MEEQVREIKQDVKEVKALIHEMLKQVAVNTHILAEHERRSTTLETMVAPLQEDYSFRRRLYVLIMGSSGFLAVAALLVSIFTLLKR